MTSHGFDMVATVDSGPDLLAALREHRPDVAVVDVRLPPTFTDEGLQAALTARREIPGLPVLVLSQHVEQLYARELLADGSGGIGYLLKDRVLGRGSVRRRRTPGRRRRDGDGPGRDREAVSPQSGGRPPHSREREVLSLMAEGRSNAAIEQRLFLTKRGRQTHREHLRQAAIWPPSDDDNRRVLAVLAYLDAA